MMVSGTDQWIDWSGTLNRIRMAARLVLGVDDLTSRLRVASYLVGNGLARVLRRRHDSRTRGDRASTIDFRLGGVAWSVHPSASHLGGIHDVWLAREYDAFEGLVAPPGGVVLDIGSNVGAYALWQWTRMDRTGTVIAVEASPRTAEALRGNVRRNGAHDEVTVLERAVWSTPGPIDFTASERTSSTAGVTATLDLGLVREGVAIEVLATTLDELMAIDRIEGRSVDVAKIDIEGAELVSLEAASEATLSRIDRFVIEMSDHTRQATIDLLVGSGFTHVGRHRNVGYFARPGLLGPVRPQS